MDRRFESGGDEPPSDFGLDRVHDAAIAMSMIRERVELQRSLRRRPLVRFALWFMGRSTSDESHAHGGVSGRPPSNHTIEDAETFVWADQAALAAIPHVRHRRRLLSGSATAWSATEFDVAAALNQLERTLEVGDSHAWMLRRHPLLGDLRPVDLVDQGCLGEVLALIETESAQH